MHILTRIVERKREELSQPYVPLQVLEEQAKTYTRRGFRQALSAPGHRLPAIIAEIKKASPSRGIFCDDFQPAEIARKYQAGGAAALSVLTDHDFFHGSLEDLKQARTATALPVLRKDFTISEYQIAEAAAHGADAILLIAAILDAPQLTSFRQYAHSFQMASLVEVHDHVELDRALASGADIIGVNNRDLRTFEVHLETAQRLAPLIPETIVRVAESGIFTRAHLAQLSAFNAFLIGESLMLANDPAQALRDLCS